MAVLTWGDLLKSQVEAQTILQAIAELIAEHNNDEEAHLAAGQSLQSHKASEIIDHLALSIVQDKIQQFQITPEKQALVNSMYNTNFADLALWTQAGSGHYIANSLSGLQIEADGSNDSYALVHSGTIWGGALNSGNGSVMQLCAQSEFDYFNYQAFYGFGPYNGKRVGFKIINDVIYAFSRQADATETGVEISDLVATDFHVYKVHLTSATTADLYIDNILVHQFSAQDWDDIYMFATMYLLNDNTGETQTLKIDYLQFYRI
jgi:hypothetical protein